ncbi:hypothetical protein [Campylobacter troglodytis]|uniref:hypothetical protein n=1 Tax=Campylobacter troglodytis TaxID=654363 RepID=UPI0011594F93|nr:hypothetical protein [Campylobacter troglodytis]TQR53187.1 hypothetical protein DMC01_11750 [Campylobacter troglodytis]
MKTLQKLRVGTLLSVCVSLVGLFFISCGSETPESLIKKKFPNETILSEEEAKAEFGFIGNKECNPDGSIRDGLLYYFIKDKEGVISVIPLYTKLYFTGKDTKEKIEKFMNTDEKMLKWTPSALKERYSQCFQ